MSYNHLIFLWKAQMVANSTRSLYFHTVIPFSNQKNYILFVSKTLKIYIKSFKTTTYDTKFGIVETVGEGDKKS